MKFNLHMRLPTNVNYLLCRHQVCKVIIVNVIDIRNVLKYEVWIMLMAEEEKGEYG